MNLIRKMAGGDINAHHRSVYYLAYSNIQHLFLFFFRMATVFSTRARWQPTRGWKSRPGLEIMRTETQTRVLRPYDVWTGRDLVSCFHFSQILAEQATVAAKETTLITGIKQIPAKWCPDSRFVFKANHKPLYPKSNSMQSKKWWFKVEVFDLEANIETSKVNTLFAITR